MRLDALARAAIFASALSKIHDAPTAFAREADRRGGVVLRGVATDGLSRSTIMEVHRGNVPLRERRVALLARERMRASAGHGRDPRVISADDSPTAAARASPWTRIAGRIFAVRAR